jgi:hypothetical protein
MFKIAFADFDSHPFGRPITARTFWRLELLMLLFVTLLLLLLMFVSPASAAQCNTIFLTDKNGNISFPFCPPNRASSTPGFIDNMTIGANVPAPGTFSNIVNTNPTPLVQGAPNAQTVSATLTAANMQTGIITVANGAAGSSALTLPLATAMDTAFPNSVAGSSFDFSVINTSGVAAETAVMTTNTGWTLVGGMTVLSTNTPGADSSVRFRARKTGAGAWTLYRLG